MTGAGKAFAIIGIILLSFLTLCGCGLMLLWVACDGPAILTGTKGSSSSDQQALLVILGFGLLFLLGGLGGIVFLGRKLRHSASAAVVPGLPSAAPVVAFAEMDTQQLRLAIIAHFVMIAISLALTAVRVTHSTGYAYTSPVKSLIFALVDSVAYAAPYIAVFIFLLQRHVYRRVLVLAIVYGFASFLMSFRWLSFLFRMPNDSHMFVGQYIFIWLAGIAIDLWIAVSGISLFNRFPDRRNAAVEFVVFAIAAFFYLLIISALTTTFATMVYRG